MMTELCDVCRSIKLRPPTILWQKVTPLLFDTEEPKSSSAQFYHHHSSFQRLQESANSGCTLCGLLVRSLQNTEDSLCSRPRFWDGIILAWYKASIESEYECSFRRKLGIDISHLTRSYSKEWDKLHVFAHWGICDCRGQVLPAYAFPDDPAAPYISSRPLPDLDLHTTFHTIKSWINSCSKYHPRVHCPLHIDEVLPKRVIDVGSSKDSTVSLFVSNNARGTYIALSHVWGTQIHNTLKMKQLEEWTRGIDMCLLPLSFKDAITVTRNLGLRYLWIDALCIVQDSPKDWDRESLKMGDVFKNSFLTIAVSATACDGFLTRESHQRSSIKLELFSSEGKNSGYVHFKSPSSPRGQIDTRAWCLQETVLSTRVLTFGLEECFFECRQPYHVSESGVYNFSDIRDFDLGGDLMKVLISPPKQNELSKAFSQEGYKKFHRYLAEEWYTLIGGGLDSFSGPGYSSRHLTRRSDKLPAISGLVHEVQILLKCNYLAGIWECNIPAGLLWSRVRGRRYWLDVCTAKQVSPRELGDPQAPSWSWAASNGPVLYPRTSFERPPIYEVSIINARTTPVGVDPMGRVSAGFIVLNGPMLELSCFRDELFSSDRRRKPSYLVIKAEERGLSYSQEPLFSQVRNELNTIQSLAASVYGKTPEPEGSICLAQFDKDDFFMSPVTCLLICKPDAEYWATGLILLSTGRDGEYRRIGFWQLPHARPDLAPLWARFERRTIMLI